MQVTATVSYGNVTWHGRLDIAIVGSGFSGLGLAIRLQQAGHRRLRRPRARRRGRRDLARQHVSRAAPATCRRTSTRSRSRPTRTGRGPTRRQPEIRDVPARVRRRLRRPPHIRLDTRGDAARAGTTTRSAGTSRPRRATCARGCWSPARARWSSRDPRPPGPRDASRARRSTRRAGTTPSTCAASAWRRSAPARRRSSSSRDRARRRAAARVPAHAAVGDAAQRTGRSRDCERRLFRRFPAAAACAARRHLRRARAAGARVRQAARGDEAARADRAPAHASARCRTRRCSRR